MQPKVKDAKTWGPLPTQAKKVEMGKLGPETRDKNQKISDKPGKTAPIPRAGTPTPDKS